MGSCKETKVIIPDYILEKDTMSEILADMHILEAMVIKTGVNDSIARDSILKQYSVIFKRHNITQEKFEESYGFYKENPEMLEEIYEKTINKLNGMQAMLGNLPKRDSLENPFKRTKH